MMPFEELDAWKSSHRLALAVYELTEGWPASERFGLTAQVRRSALSIPANIAEGVAKRGTRELRRYLDISLGSFSELTYLLLFARDRGLPTSSDLEPLRSQTGRQLWGLYRSIASP
jgi:four helix bundle protein